MKSKPKILYKYRSLSGDNFKFTHDIFIKSELYFAHPDQINDPFDCKISSNLKNLTKEQLIKQLESAGWDLTKIQELISNGSLSELQAHFTNATKSHKNVGVLSFSENYNDILMWGHYADSHNGICIGFDYRELSFIYGKAPLIPDSIEYPPGNEYPEWKPFVDDVTKQINDIYFTKSIDWKYEQEWRVVFPKQGRSSQKINPNALVSVHFGCQIAKGDKETVINWCLQREQKPKLYEMIKDESSYSLKENVILY